MNALRFAWLQLVRDPLTTGIVVAALAVAFGAGVALLGLRDATTARGAALDPPFDLVVGPKTNGLSLVLDAFELRAPPEDVIPYGMRDSLAERYPGTFIASLHVLTRARETWVVAPDDAWFERPPDLDPPRLVEGAWLAREGEIVLGVRAAERLGLGVGDAFAFGGSPSQAQVDAARARDPERRFTRTFDPAPLPWSEAIERPLWTSGGRVVGIVEHGHPVFDDAAFVHRDTGEMKHRLAYDEDLARRVSSNGASTFLYLRAPSPDLIPAIHRTVHRNSTTMFARVDEELAELRGLHDRVRAGFRALLILVALALAAGLTLLFQLRYDALRPRLALLRSLGYPPAWILRVTLAEGLLLVGAGWALGALAAASLAPRLAPDDPSLRAWVTDAAWDTTSALAALAAGLAAVALATAGSALRLAREGRSHDASSLG